VSYACSAEALSRAIERATVVFAAAGFDFDCQLGYKPPRRTLVWTGSQFDWYEDPFDDATRDLLLSCPHREQIIAAAMIPKLYKLCLRQKAFDSAHINAAAGSLNAWMDTL